jgi:hypothetical protein
LPADTHLSLHPLALVSVQPGAQTDRLRHHIIIAIGRNEQVRQMPVRQDQKAAIIWLTVAYTSHSEMIYQKIL